MQANRHLAAALIATLLALAPGAAHAQLGESPQHLLDAIVEYSPAPSDGGYLVASGFRFEIEAQGDVALGITGSGALSDANIRFLGDLIGAASGYGAGIAAPVADYFRTRASELVGAGEVALEVMEYLMYVDITAPAELEPSSEAEAAPAAPGPDAVSLRFVPQVIEGSRFAPAAHALGPADAAHVVRLFTDLQCPFCAQFESVGMPIVVDELLPRGDVRFEFHHFPLKSIHPNAVAAAEATECVADEVAQAGGHQAGEDAFWAYQTALFDEQASWAKLPDPVPAFVAVADGLELPSENLAACVRGGEQGAKIEEAYRSAAQDLRLTGTPTVFVDGLKVGDYRFLADYLRLMRLSTALSERAAHAEQP